MFDNTGKYMRFLQTGNEDTMFSIIISNYLTRKIDIIDWQYYIIGPLIFMWQKFMLVYLFWWYLKYIEYVYYIQLTYYRSSSFLHIWNITLELNVFTTRCAVYHFTGRLHKLVKSVVSSSHCLTINKHIQNINIIKWLITIQHIT